jgi:hypothetical protein
MPAQRLQAYMLSGANAAVASALSHPERFSETRPYASKMRRLAADRTTVVPPGEHGAWARAATVRNIVNNTLACLDSERKLPMSTADFAAAEAEDAWHYFLYCRFGYRQYAVTWRQAQALLQNGDDRPSDELRFPHPAAYIRVNLEQPLALANGADLDGAYVSYHDDERFCTVLLAPRGTLNWPDVADHGDAFHIELGRANRSVGQAIDASFATAERHTRDVLCRVLERHGLAGLDSDSVSTLQRDHVRASYQTARRSVALALEAAHQLSQGSANLHQ